MADQKRKKRLEKQDLEYDEPNRSWKMQDLENEDPGTSKLANNDTVTGYCSHVDLSFLPARRYASAGLCDSDVSVRPSVRLSVTRRYCA